jgi:hypothetical protein
MAWGKVDDNLAFHPKVIEAGNDAMGLWVRALSWSMSILSDGYVPAGMVTAFNGDKCVNKLVDAGLWIAVDGGFQFKDWDQYQPTKEHVLSERASAKERMARVRGQKSDRNSPERSDVVRANIGRSSTTPTRPDPSVTKEHLGGTKRANRIPDDFSITNEMANWAQETIPGLDIRPHTAMFIDYWQSASGANARKMDWIRAWQVWMRREYMKVPVNQRVVTQPPKREQIENSFCKSHYGYPLPCDRCVIDATGVDHRG